MCINYPPFPTNIFYDVNFPYYIINTMDIDDIEKYSSYSLRDISKWYTIPCENKPPSEF